MNTIRWPRIYQAVHFEPWLIEASAHGAIVEVLHSRLFGEQVVIQPGQSKEDELPVIAAGESRIDGSSRYASAVVDANGIATVTVDGILSRAASAFEKSCYGGVGPQDVTQSLAAAMDEDRVRGIILAVSSPGGTVAGIPEAGDYIRGLQEDGRKPLYAFTDQMMASAAYWLACGASRIYATRLANVGSIGVYMPWVDQSARAAMSGMRVELIKDGKFKGAGYPGTSLTRDQEALLQAEVNAIGVDFRAHVSNSRPRVSRDDMEGQSFLGKDAAERGFVDGVVPDLTAVKARMLPRLADSGRKEEYSTQ